MCLPGSTVRLRPGAVAIFDGAVREGCIGQAAAFGPCPEREGAGAATLERLVRTRHGSRARVLENVPLNQGLDRRLLDRHQEMAAALEADQPSLGDRRRGKLRVAIEL
jgi:hypothetical protein